MKIGIIIQARVDSIRFPKKVITLIDNKPILLHVINQCKDMGLEIIVATTKRKIDDPIVKIAEKAKVRFFRGSKNDVLDRYYQAAKKFGLKGIIRITSDCPMVDPKESIKVVKFLKLNNIDYVSLDDKTYPDGLDTEGFSFQILEKAWKNAKMKSEREHVTPHIKKNCLRKKIIPYKNNLSHVRLTVDYIEDIQFLESIFNLLKNKNIIHLKNIIKIIEKNPHLVKINSIHERNEGYSKSLREDKIITK